MATLVTGATGLLGSACVKLLLERGEEVIALVQDRDPSSRLYQLSGFIEVRDELATVERVVGEYRPRQVLHLAAQTQVPTANRAPLSTFESNVRGTWRLLEALRVYGDAEAIVVASSDKAYGLAPPPYTEQTPLQPVAPYDVSKACTDLIARSYAQHFGLPVTVTRCGNLYGPGDANQDRLVPGVIRALARGEAPTLRSRGLMSREWLFVEDAARANLLLLDNGARGEAVNVGGGQRATALDVTRRLIELSGVDIEPVVASQDPAGEIPHQALDCRRLAALGWAASTPLSEGLALTWSVEQHRFSASGTNAGRAAD